MEDLRDWVARRLGAAVRLVALSRPDGEAEVWRVDEGDRTLAYLKRHRVRDKWSREQAVLDALAQGPVGAMVPRVLDRDAQAGVLLLEARPGRPASEVTWTPARARRLHEQAGRFRAGLDALPLLEPDPLPLCEALRRRHDGWQRRAPPSLPRDLLRGVAERFDPSCFEGATRRMCHRDFSLRNFIVDPTADDPALGVIDFGRARPDAWLVDVVELWDGPWRDEPSLADAFWSGYGRRLEPIEHEQLRQLALLHGLATAAWGDRHGHPGFSAEGRQRLYRGFREHR